MPIDNIANFKDNTSFSAPVEVLPLLPLRGAMLYPGMLTHLDIGRESSLRTVEVCMRGDKRIFLLAQKNIEEEYPKLPDLYLMGTVAEIKNVFKIPGGGTRVIVEGHCRALLRDLIDKDTYLCGRIELVAPLAPISIEAQGAARIVKDKFAQYCSVFKKIPADTVVAAEEITDPGALADFVLGQMNLSFEQRQKGLELTEVLPRLMYVGKLLVDETDILRAAEKIEAEVRASMDENQKMYYLREQEKAIRKELNEKEDKDKEVDEYIEKLKKANMPQATFENAKKEAEKLAKMAPIGPETSVLRNYLDWLIDIPWANLTEDNQDLKQADMILNEDHYGLEKPKERILEYLAVAKLTKEIKGPILCLVGPPGVGKTSLAKSVARALNRKYVRVSLGGIRDEAEIRGHRRTYVGALPGRIIQGLKKAGTRNPVFLLDEIDKLASADFRGDPASALLEVLDPEQNANFSDHYIEEPVDLSKVLFIVTANVASNIPKALMDRMEIIEMSGYTQQEKRMIGKNYLVKKQAKENGLTKENIEITDEAINCIIENYTREAGIRSLEREVGRLCRKAAKEIASGTTEFVKIDADKVKDYLGIPKYSYDEMEKRDSVGSALGLAWTEVGGEVLHIETLTMKGKGDIVLTGNLGDVMKESASAAVSYIRAHGEEYGIEPETFKEKDIHVHVPQGATPKDGPSAGVTIFTSVVSELTQKPVPRDLCMTGEITLRGKVLPIGGVKEKMMAGYRTGCKTILLPVQNKKDLEEVPKEIQKSMEIHFVEDLQEVYRWVFQ